jgi:phosphoglycolate phosphatase
MGINRLPLPAPRAVLFDWDGTLVDSSHGLVRAYNLVRAAFDMAPVTREYYMDQVAPMGNSRTIFTQLVPHAVEKAIEIFYAEIRDHYNETIDLMPGVMAVLADIQARGITMGIVSNLAQEHLDRGVDRLGVRPFMSVVIGADQSRPGKPDPAPIFMALDDLGVPRDLASRVWFVGDSSADRDAAAAAGCPFIYFHHDTTIPAHRDGDAAAIDHFSDWDRLMPVAKR